MGAAPGLGLVLPHITAAQPVNQFSESVLLVLTSPSRSLQHACVCQTVLCSSNIAHSNITQIAVCVRVCQ